VGVTQVGGREDFLDEAAGLHGLRQVGAQDLDGNGSVVLQVPSPVHCGHPTSADPILDDEPVLQCLLEERDRMEPFREVLLRHVLVVRQEGQDLGLQRRVPAARLVQERFPLFLRPLHRPEKDLFRPRV